ncbi:Dihydroxy-acid dehydratase [bioreactor metagenome]|uniref:dihydroxy-acid dehydratase n=1 Tax=bioreactor metagenome TaxID=1076179 RepID=A0A644TGK8_9ZZZZ|nr:dihydroxy-acid dehydratase [Negativicutes bacterium]
MELRCRKVVEGLDHCENRALYKSMGYTDEDLSKPLIGIANAWSTVVPGHYNLRQVSEAVKEGIRFAGGTPVEFGVIGACDGIAGGHGGTRYVLPTRELIANDVESMTEGHGFSGIVLLGSCDKILPGMLMAAARVNIPSILVCGGPSLQGCYWNGRYTDSTSLAVALGQYQKGKITQEKLEELEDQVMPTCGSCSMLGTANTMSCVTEALGMMLPGTAAIPAVYAHRFQAARQSGEQIVRLVREGITPRAIMTKGAMMNAVRLCSAIGGSTNVALHLSALAYELEMDFDMKIFDEWCRTTPLLVKLNPASAYNLTDFYRVGGVPRVLDHLRPLLEENVLTVTGETLLDNLHTFAVRQKEQDELVVRNFDDPYEGTGGLAVLWGNLAPDSAITKPAAIDPYIHVFRGRAHCFDSEEDVQNAVQGGRIRSGDVLVVRYEGPSGGPGMPELFKSMKLIDGLGLAKQVALITDGRFSGTNSGCFVGHISPEASRGGPIALVEDGDYITIDIPRRSLHLEVSSEELLKRKSAFSKKPPSRISHGYLNLYSRLVESAAQGAIIRHREE